MQQHPELTEREREILHAVVNSYITSAEAVGSRTVVKRFGMEISPATVRNVMADLEEMGLLEQLHTSSGRVPTGAGYQYYIDHLMRVQELTLRERRRIEEELSERLDDADGVLRRASHLLALVSHHAGLAETPADTAAVAMRVDLVRVGPAKLAMLVVDNFGRVRSVMAQVASPMGDAELEQLNRFMNEHLHGAPVDQLSVRVEERLRVYLDEQRRLAQRALEVLELLPRRPQGMLIVEGTSQLLEQPEFQDMRQARDVFNLLEEREQLLDLLRSAAAAEGARPAVLLGGGGRRLEGLGLVAAPYEVDGKKAGMIGVLGPRRMQYSKLTAVVEFTAGLVGRLLTRLSG